MRGKSTANNLAALVCIGIAAAQNARPESARDAAFQAVDRNNRAVQLASEGHNEAAEEMYRAALSAAYIGDPVRAKIATNLAEFYQRLDRYKDAERLFRFALKWRQKNLPAESTEIAYSLNNLGEIYRVEGRDWEARNLMDAAARSLQQFHPEAAGLPIILTNLAIAMGRFGEIGRAEELLRSALASFSRRQEQVSLGYGVALNNLGQLLETKSDLATAALFYAQAVAVFERLGAPAQSDLASALANIGELDLRLDRSEDAQQSEQRAMGLLKPGGDALLRAQILHNLGNIVARTGNPEGSLPYFEQSLVIQDKTFGAEHINTAGLLLDYASATEHAGKKSLSRKLHKRAESLLAQLGHLSMNQMTVSVSDLRAAK